MTGVPQTPMSEFMEAKHGQGRIQGYQGQALQAILVTWPRLEGLKEMAGHLSRRCLY